MFLSVPYGSWDVICFKGAHASARVQGVRDLWGSAGQPCQRLPQEPPPPGQRGEVGIENFGNLANIFFAVEISLKFREISKKNSGKHLFARTDAVRDGNANNFIMPRHSDHI